MDHHAGDEAGGEGTVLLFYKYVPIAEPEEHAAWQQALCQRLGLTGKLRIAHEGINGTLGGAREATDVYRREVEAHPLFAAANIQWKTSPGHASSFDELSVRVVTEIITLGVPGLGAEQAGTHLSPERFHQALMNRDDDVVLIDCRNDYESRIGRFEGAIAPPVRKFSLFPKWVDDNMDNLKDKKVMMYCTGGIRCEKGSAYLRNRGIQEVYQLEGGIHKYIEEYPDGYFRGKNYVFDLRQAIAANEDVLSSCMFCSIPYDHYVTCSSQDCFTFLLACESCRSAREGKVFCTKECEAMGPKWNKVTKTPKSRPGRNERRRRRMQRRREQAIEESRILGRTVPTREPSPGLLDASSAEDGDDHPSEAYVACMLHTEDEDHDM